MFVQQGQKLGVFIMHGDERQSRKDEWEVASCPIHPSISNWMLVSLFRMWNAPYGGSGYSSNFDIIGWVTFCLVLSGMGHAWGRGGATGMGHGLFGKEDEQRQGNSIITYTFLSLSLHIHTLTHLIFNCCQTSFIGKASGLVSYLSHSLHPNTTTAAGSSRYFKCPSYHLICNQRNPSNQSDNHFA